MDIFCEYMVKKQKRGMDYLKIAGILVLVLIVLLALTLFLGMYSFPFACGAIYGGYWLITREDVEFEYIVTNSVLDVDKIMAKRSRKRLLSVDFKEIESFDIAESVPENVKITDATPNGIGDGAYIVKFSKDGERKALLFKPNGKVLKALKKANPRVVLVDTENIEEQ